MRKPHKNARTLRKEMPSAEKRLWFFIRKRQLGDFRFRRQHTIGPYIADFACVEAMLVIELDGDSHGTDEAATYDERRNAFMEAQGWIVRRHGAGCFVAERPEASAPPPRDSLEAEFERLVMDALHEGATPAALRAALEAALKRCKHAQVGR